MVSLPDTCAGRVEISSLLFLSQEELKKLYALHPGSAEGLRLHL